MTTTASRSFALLFALAGVAGGLFGAALALA